MESADKRYFKEVLRRAAQMGEKRGAIYFGVYRDYFYLKDQLSLKVREKIRKQGKADISEIASEIQVDPKLLKTIYYNLRRERLLENVRILKKNDNTYKNSRITLNLQELQVLKHILTQ